ncbi:MAG: molybdopterin-dependent oxidoreductase [Planctomycetaceae bacterium]|nr:molybdopterin-dependent oxidoreductase [Planctomycetaceae bacterium]
MTDNDAGVDDPLAALFFESPSGWLRECRRRLAAPSRPAGAGERYLADLDNVDENALIADYSRLFWGTEAGVIIPLWASACRHNGPILADATTLEVIRWYERFGFRPTAPDGNPPDHISTMYRFCGFLDEARAFAAKGEFVQAYLLDTLSEIAEGIGEHGAIPVLKNFVAALLVAAANVPFTEDGEGVRSTLPGAKPEIIRTGGFNNCGGKCVITAAVDSGCVLSLDTDTGDNAPQIRACVRGRAYRHTFFHAERLRYPLLRIGKRGEGKFKRIGWDDAIDRIAREWIRIRDAYGPASRYVLYSTGVTSMMRPDKMAKRLLNLDGGFLDAYNTYSDACATYVTPYIYGDTRSGNAVEDIPNSRLILLWGHNPAETIFGSERNYYLAKARENGTRVIVIDPRRSDSALAQADEWIGIVPSTDSALADGMAYVVWTERLWDKEFMDTFCLGFDEEHMPPGIPAGESYEAYLFGRQDGVVKSPGWASAITGVPADTIVRLAREYATAKPACLLPGYGPQCTGNGEQTTRSLALLTCLTGNVGIPGGGAGGVGLVSRHAESSFPIPNNPYPGKIPHFLWTRAVDAARSMTVNDGLVGVERLQTPVKMLFCLASNTLVNQHSDINRTARILEDEDKCEFIVCSDLFMTASARFADIVLPAVSGFETDNITAPWGYGNYVLFNNRIRPPLFECRFEWDWLREVAGKLGLREEFEDGKPAVGDWLRHFLGEMRKKEPELPSYADFRERGGHNYREKKVFIAYEKQRRDFANNPFPTPSGKIEIFSPRLHALGRPIDIPAIPKYTPCPEGPEDPLRATYPLQLIGWHTKRRTHSIHDNNPLLDEVEPQRLWIHPVDAAARGIADEDEVLVYNDRGMVRIRARVTDRIIRSVVAMPQGAWYRPDRNGVDHGGSINVLTSHRPTPLAKGNPQHTNLVEVVRAG